QKAASSLTLQQCPFRDYDLVALSELYCPSKHRKRTCGWLHGKVKTPESRVMISMLIIFFGIDS
ncbi:hypothetical protein ACNDX0_005368, partial [Escherichia coli]